MKKSHILVVGFSWCILLGLYGCTEPLLAGEGEPSTLQWSEDTRLTTNSLQDRSPSFMLDSEGVLWFLWVAQTYTGEDILYKTFDKSWTTGLRVTSSPLSDNFPSIFQDVDNTIWVVWSSSRDRDVEIYYKTFNGSWSDDTRLTENEGEDTTPIIFQSADNTIWVVWSSFREDNYDIYYKTFTGAWSEDIPLTESPGDDYNPTIFQDKKGTIWFFWESAVIDNWEIHYRTFDGSWGEETLLCTSRQIKMSYSILQDTTGIIWAVWDCLREDNYDIYYKTFDDGWSDDVQLTNTPGHDYNPFIFQDADNTIWVLWDSERIFGNRDIYFKTFTDSWSDDIRFTSDDGKDVNPQIIQDNTDTIWIFWDSERDGNQDIYYKRGNHPVPWWFQLNFLAILTMVGLLVPSLVGWYKKFPVSFNRFAWFVTQGKLVPFIKISPNPYIAGTPVKSEEMFFGREDIFEFLSTRLKSGSDVVIVLHGQRRTGKSSILYQIEYGRLGNQFIPVYIDIQGILVDNDEEFLREIAKGIMKKLEKYEPESFSSMEKIFKTRWNKGNTYITFGEFLDRCSDIAGDRHLIIMFDEYERLAEKNILHSEMTGFLRSWLQTRRNFSFIFAGTRELEKIEEYWSLLLNSAVYKKISILRKKDALALMKKPVKSLIQYDSEVREQILKLTSCHPYLLQFMLQNLVDHVNEKRDYRVTVDDVQEVVAYMKKNPPPDFLYQWKRLPDDQKIVLSVMASFPAGSREISLEEMSLKLVESDVGIEESDLKEILKDLEEKDVIEISQSGNVYLIKFELYGLWIAHEHPLSRILEEIE